MIHLTLGQSCAKLDAREAVPRALVGGVGERNVVSVVVREGLRRIGHRPTSALVLGLDAAWTENGTSGVALVQLSGGKRELLAAAPSYAGFIHAAHGEPVDWNRPRGGVPNIPGLLSAAARIGGDAVNIVAIDMPLATKPITGRRNADNEVSRAFGAVGAAVHSPTPARPGAFGWRMSQALADAGFALATQVGTAGTRPALVETYPLAALVRLLGYKPRYKTARLSRYLRGGPILVGPDRVRWLLDEWQPILATLEERVDGIRPLFTECEVAQSTSRLKPYEDVIDAIVSAWVGTLYCEGAAEPFGDVDAAIWLPQEVAQKPHSKQSGAKVRTQDVLRHVF